MYTIRSHADIHSRQAPKLGHPSTKGETQKYVENTQVSDLIPSNYLLFNFGRSFCRLDDRDMQ